MQVHHGDDNILIRLDPKQDPEGEGACQAATNVALDESVQERVDLNSVKGVLNGDEKPPAQLRLLGLVVCRRLHHPGFGLGMEPDRLHPSAEWALSNASSASRSSTSPLSTSRHLFRTSSRHAGEISPPGSASRLSMSFSATNARACAGRLRASETILSTVVLVLLAYPHVLYRSIPRDGAACRSAARRRSCTRWRTPCLRATSARPRLRQDRR